MQPEIQLLRNPWRRQRHADFRPAQSRLRAAAKWSGSQSLLWYIAQTGATLSLWFVASIIISFSNKHLLSTLDFKYPFFLTFCTNAGVALVTKMVTSIPTWRQPLLQKDLYRRVIVPLSLATTLDIGFSNWSLALLSVSFHVIIKGTSPLFVMACGMGLGVERASRQTPLAITLIVVGLSLVACDRLTLPDRPLGIILGVLSVSFTGLRWALTQLLIRGRRADIHSSSTSDGQRAGPPTHPLSSMLHTSPVIAAGALVLVLTSSERDVVGRIASLTTDEARRLLAYLAVLILLVWSLVLAEYKVSARGRKAVDWPLYSAPALCLPHLPRLRARAFARSSLSSPTFEPSCGIAREPHLQPDALRVWRLQGGADGSSQGAISNQR